MNNKVKTVTIVAAVAILGVGAAKLASNEDNGSDKTGKSDNHMNNSGNKSDNQASSVQETNQVTYRDFDVVQKVIKVKKGTTVTWTNEDSAQHDVTPDVETADFKASELFGKSETYQVTFNTPGTYTYYCSPHPYMKGTVEVTE